MLDVRRLRLLRVLAHRGRRVELTPAAHGLVAHAEAVLERLEQAQADLAAGRAGPAGPLRIGAFPSAARAVVPAALAALAEAHPDLERSEEHTSELQSHSDLVCR